MDAKNHEIIQLFKNAELDADFRNGDGISLVQTAISVENHEIINKLKPLTSEESYHPPKKIIENIDVGGPTMVRSAAKNYNDVTVITSSSQYKELIHELEEYKGSTSLNFREKLSRIAFSETAYYDSVISNYLNNKTNNIFPLKKVFPIISF